MDSEMFELYKLLDGKEKYVEDLKGKNYHLKKQVVMFQRLMRDEERLSRVVAKLEKENLIRGLG